MLKHTYNIRKIIIDNWFAYTTQILWQVWIGLEEPTFLSTAIPLDNCKVIYY